MAKRKGKRKGRGRRGGRGRGLGKSNGAINAIPAIDVSVKTAKNIARYESNSALTNAVIYADYLITTLCAIATAATQVSSVFFAIKILYIKFYLPATVGSPSNPGMVFEWFHQSGNTYDEAPKSVHEATLGTASGATRTFIPPKNSMSSHWLSLTNPAHSQIFVVNVPSGTTMEIAFCAFAENLDSVQTLTGYTGLTPGKNYRGGPDGLASASSVWKVLGYNPM